MYRYMKHGYILRDQKSGQKGLDINNTEMACFKIIANVAPGITQIKMVIKAFKHGVSSKKKPMSSESLHDGMDKTCIQQATSFPVVMQHKPMPTENFYECGIAHSADSNSMCSIPPLLLHQRSW